MKTFYDLQEGLYDPNIFKAFFLAGGPGSGKSYVAGRTMGGHGLKSVNQDEPFEYLLKKAGLSLKMPPEESERKEVQRQRSKDITKARQANYLEGRLGLVIDGTGKDANKILGQKSGLEELGYDTYMIYVNTSLDVALQRNAERSRSVPEPIVVKAWKDVQANIGTFSNMFRAGFIVVDNNNAGEDILKQVEKRVRGLLRRKVTNTRAKNWMAAELARKQRK
jgi:dephospho-CoA kinase